MKCFEGPRLLVREQGCSRSRSTCVAAPSLCQNELCAGPILLCFLTCSLPQRPCCSRGGPIFSLNFSFHWPIHSALAYLSNSFTFFFRFTFTFALSLARLRTTNHTNYPRKKTLFSGTIAWSLDRLDTRRCCGQDALQRKKELTRQPYVL
ncbi:hypothetical protein BC828DRAFT_280323 [Blastocladiella britannica]|nr:hypothetical protein BC828DRAFT_280323 [Blastocladiella britannica]